MRPGSLEAGGRDQERRATTASLAPLLRRAGQVQLVCIEGSCCRRLGEAAELSERRTSRSTRLRRPPRLLLLALPATLSAYSCRAYLPQRRCALSRPVAGLLRGRERARLRGHVARSFGERRPVRSLSRALVQLPLSISQSRRARKESAAATERREVLNKRLERPSPSSPRGRRRLGLPRDELLLLTCPTLPTHELWASYTGDPDREGPPRKPRDPKGARRRRSKGRPTDEQPAQL